MKGRYSNIPFGIFFKRDINPAKSQCMFVSTVLIFRPIKGQKKTFEELLEEQLQLEEQRLKSAEQQVIEYNRKHQQ